MTPADVAAKEAMLEAVRIAVPGDGFVGEEVGETLGTTGRRWIVPATATTPVIIPEPPPLQARLLELLGVDRRIPR